MSIFTKIIAGEIPGHFVWRDPLCVAFLSIQPIRPGHTLVVPRAEVDHWIDMPPDLAGHVFEVAHRIANGLQQVHRPVKVGLVILGLEVRHTHLHLVPIWSEKDLDFRNARPATSESLAEEAARIRDHLTALGHPEVSAHD